MIRAILVFILVMLVYQALKVLFRSALNAARGGDREDRLPGAEMVQDPQCRTYIVKDRAVVRQINGERLHFCSAACADEYERSHRS